MGNTTNNEIEQVKYDWLEKANKEIELYEIAHQEGFRHGLFVSAVFALVLAVVLLAYVLLTSE